jgi:hypothetical protein
VTVATSGATASTSPYVTLLGFTRYVGRTGPGKANFVGGLRRQRETRAGFNPHGQLVKALKADIQFRTGGSHLDATLDAVKPRWRPLYEVLVAGAHRYLASLDDGGRVDVVPTRDALGVLGGLTVKVNPHFGLRYEDGRGEVVRLHFDEDPPQQETLLATLYLLTRHAEQLLPHAEPVVVDLRRGEVHRADPSAKPADIERWLAGEAAAFAAMWGTAA